MIDKLIAFLCRNILIAACGVFVWGLGLICLRYPFVVLILVGLVVWLRLRGWKGSDWSHGSASIASLAEIERGWLLGGDGLILGRRLADSP